MMEQESNSDMANIEIHIERKRILEYPFPFKLWLLIHLDYTNALEWNYDGTVMLVNYKPLCQYLESPLSIFHARNYPMFLCSLKEFDFKCITKESHPDVGVIFHYQHEYFRRNNLYLVSRIRRNIQIAQWHENTIKKSHFIIDENIHRVHDKAAEQMKNDRCFQRCVTLSAKQIARISLKIIAEFNSASYHLKYSLKHREHENCSTRLQKRDNEEVIITLPKELYVNPLASKLNLQETAAEYAGTYGNIPIEMLKNFFGDKLPKYGDDSVNTSQTNNDVSSSTVKEENNQQQDLQQTTQDVYVDAKALEAKKDSTQYNQPENTNQYPWYSISKQESTFNGNTTNEQLTESYKIKTADQYWCDNPTINFNATMTMNQNTYGSAGNAYICTPAQYGLNNFMSPYNNVQDCKPTLNGQMAKERALEASQPHGKTGRENFMPQFNSTMLTKHAKYAKNTPIIMNGLNDIMIDFKINQKPVFHGATASKKFGGCYRTFGTTKLSSRQNVKVGKAYKIPNKNKLEATSILNGQASQKSDSQENFAKLKNAFQILNRAFLKKHSIRDNADANLNMPQAASHTSTDNKMQWQQYPMSNQHSTINCKATNEQLKGDYKTKTTDQYRRKHHTTNSNSTMTMNQNKYESAGNAYKSIPPQYGLNNFTYTYNDVQDCKPTFNGQTANGPAVNLRMPQAASHTSTDDNMQWRQYPMSNQQSTINRKATNKKLKKGYKTKTTDQYRRKNRTTNLNATMTKKQNKCFNKCKQTLPNERNGMQEELFGFLDVSTLVSNSLNILYNDQNE